MKKSVMLGFVLSACLGCSLTVMAAQNDTTQTQAASNTNQVSNDNNIKVYKQDVKSIMVTENDAEFIIQLPSNRTTGYSWFVKRYNHKMIVPVSAKYFSPKQQMPGAGGYVQWTFKVKPYAFKVPHMTKIKMVYAQPWDLKQGKSQTFVIVTK